MDNEEAPPLKVSRLGFCEVCNDCPAKYTCPGCEVKTCSLPCVKLHKKELNCSGLRNKVKFKPLKDLDNFDFKSDTNFTDYIMLEEATRATEVIKKKGTNLKNSNLSMAKIKLKKAVQKRNIHLCFLPKAFTRHKSNTTYYNWKENKISWKVEWVFPEADMVSCVDDRVPEIELLSVSLSKYIDSEKCEPKFKKMLSCYHNVENDQIKVLLKEETNSSRKFYLVNKNESLTENLSNKHILEHPIFYVILLKSLPNYKVEPGQPNEQKFSKNYVGSNLLFNFDLIEDY